MHLKHAANIRVGHLPGEGNFTAKTVEHAVVTADLSANGFHSDAFAKLQIFRFVDLAHSTPARQLDDPKTAEQELTGIKDGEKIGAQKAHELPAGGRLVNPRVAVRIERQEAD